MIGIVTEIVGQQELLASFVKLEDLYDDLRPVFEAVGDEALGDMRRRIENHPGPALKASTIKRKGGTRILRDTDNLYGSFQKGASNNVFRVRATDGEFGTSDSKAGFHQFGTGRMPKRTIIEVTGEQEARFSQIASDVQIERIKALGFQIS